MRPLFVYGSLMRGESNAHMLRGAHFLGENLSGSGYALVDLGPYPGMVAARGAGRVAGELYAVEALLLAKLDVFEEHPHVYRRSFIQTLAGDVVQAYLLRPEHARGLPVLASGCWRRRDEAGERHRAVDLPGGHKP